MISPSSHSLHNTHIYMSTKSNISHSSMSKHRHHHVQIRFHHSSLTKAKYWRAYTGQMTSIASENQCLTMQSNSLSIYLFPSLFLLFPSMVQLFLFLLFLFPPLPLHGSVLALPLPHCCRCLLLPCRCCHCLLPHCCCCLSPAPPTPPACSPLRPPLICTTRRLHAGRPCRPHA